MINSRRDELLQRLAINRRRLLVLTSRTATAEMQRRIQQAHVWNSELEADVLRATPKASPGADARLWDQLAWQISLTEALIKEVDREQGDLS